MSIRQPAEWNASVYHQVSNPHVGWGRTVLSDLTLRGDETAIDAGCGSGRLTAELLELLPDGHVIAIDRSANMVAEARANLARFGNRVTIVQADVGRLSLADVGDAPVDLIFSTATFHWIRDHDALFRGLLSVLKPGGLLSAQCGGGPNLASLLQRVERQMRSSEFGQYFDGWNGPWEFADDVTTASRLRDSGFTNITTWLYQSPTPMDDASAYGTFLTNVILGEHLTRIPEDLRERFVAQLVEGAAAEDPPYVFDYWRLNMRANRPLDS
ncbi:MAG: methyltransferase domain-containing protein [Thermomicrobiales bacterium]